MNKYEKWYSSLIDKAKNRIIEENTYYEKHHILPKCMGGTNDESNLVKLTGREHAIAHMILANIYPDSNSLKFALAAMTLKKKNRNPNEYFSSRQIANFREEANKSRKGTKMPDWFGKRISECNKSRVWSEDSKRKLSESNKGKKKSKEHLEKLKQLWSPGHEPWNKGKKMSEETKEKLKESRKHLSAEAIKNYSESAKKRGYCGHMNKIVIDTINNIEYNSISKCAKALNVSDWTIRNWISTKPEKGLKYKTN